jgi:hypothetical protein
VQGDIEIRPLRACTRCGLPVAPPLGPSYVYGIGALGFQHCAGCGARWRCMWPTAAPVRRFPVRAAALTAAALLVLVAGVAAYANTRGDEPRLAAATRDTESPGPSVEASPAGERYREIVGPANEAKADLQEFLASIPPVTPQREIDRRVAEYAAVARRTDDALEDGPWPAAARAAVADLVAADVVFTGALARNAGQLNLPSYSTRLATDAAAVRRAANQVRTVLGLALVAAPRDPRFAPL